MTAAENDWDQFCEKAPALMRDALQTKEGLAGRRPLHRKNAFGQLVDFFEDNEFISDSALRSDIVNLLMEVGGSGPKYYMELLKLLESRASEDQLRRYFDC